MNIWAMSYVQGGCVFSLSLSSCPTRVRHALPDSRLEKRAVRVTLAGQHATGSSLPHILLEKQHQQKKKHNGRPSVCICIHIACVYKYAFDIHVYNATMPGNLYILRKEMGDGGHCLGDIYTLHQRHVLAKACALYFAIRHLPQSNSAQKGRTPPYKGQWRRRRARCDKEFGGFVPSRWFRLRTACTRWSITAGGYTML